MKKWLWFIVFLGLVLRLWKYSSLPYSPSGDEVAFGYYGWSLLHFGMDEFGKKFPVYFASIGDFKYPVLAYLNMIPAALFGLSEMAIRFWSIAGGTIEIVLIYYLVLILTGSNLSGLFSALLLAVSPWSLIVSRSSYEAHIATILITGALLISQLAIKKRLNLTKSLVGIIILLGLSMYTYSATRVTIPVLVFGMLLVKLQVKKERVFLFTILVVMSAISLLSFVPWESRARAGGVVLRLTDDDKEMLLRSTVEAGISPVKPPIFLTRVFHNKVRYTLSGFTKEFLSYFSPDFLFMDGKGNNESAPMVGMLLLSSIALIPLGFSRLFGSKNYLLIIWLISAPLAAAMTGNGPNMIRANQMMIPLLSMSGIGLAIFFENKASKIKKIIGLILLIGLLYNTLFFFNQYFVHKNVMQPWKSSQGTREMVRTVHELLPKYKNVVMPDDNYIFYLFYNKVSPKEFLKDAKILPTKPDDRWDRVESFGKLIYKMGYECPKAGKLNTLYVCIGTNIPQNAKIIRTFPFADGIPHYTLIEFIPYSEVPEVLPPPPEHYLYMIDRDGLYQKGYIPDSEPKFW